MSKGERIGWRTNHSLCPTIFPYFFPFLIYEHNFTSTPLLTTLLSHVNLESLAKNDRHYPSSGAISSASNCNHPEPSEERIWQLRDGLYPRAKKPTCLCNRKKGCAEVGNQRYRWNIFRVVNQPVRYGTRGPVSHVAFRVLLGRRQLVFRGFDCEKGRAAF